MCQSAIWWSGQLCCSLASTCSRPLASGSTCLCLASGQLRGRSTPDQSQNSRSDNAHPTSVVFVPVLCGAQIFVCIMVDDTLFYWSHRLLHHPKIYGMIHKKHHTFKHTIGIAVEYVATYSPAALEHPTLNMGVVSSRIQVRTSRRGPRQQHAVDRRWAAPPRLACDGLLDVLGSQALAVD